MNDTVIGKPIDRVDGRLKVTGGALYAAEARVARPAHAVLVQSTIAKGRIRRLDTTDAENADGVLTIITHKNRPRLKWPGSDYSGANAGDGQRPPLADDQVHYNGQHIAVVVAETFEQANYAASLIQVTYDNQTPELALSKAHSIQPKTFFDHPLQVHKGDVDHGIAQGAAKIEQTYTTPTQTNNPMEPSATVAVWNGERLTVYDATQAVDNSRNMLAYAFDLPRAAVRVIDPFVGGGFGCKGFQWSHTVIAALAARRTGRPVRLVLTRAQMFTSVGHRSRTRQTLTLAAGHDGTLTAMRHDTDCETATTGLFVEPCGVGATSVMYASPNIAYSHRVAHINIAMPTPMRAPGETPGTYALESAMDELAYALKMDPIDLRRKNNAKRHPIKDRPWSSKHLNECYRLGAEKFGWHKRSPKPRSMSDGDWRVGWGMATATYPAHRSAATARARLIDDGSAVVGCATQDLGTGSYTIFSQIAAEALGLPVDKIRFVLGDTSLPPGPVSGGSKSAASVGPAVATAAKHARERLIALAVGDTQSPLHGADASQIQASGGRLVLKSDASRGETYSALLKRNKRKAVTGEAHAQPGADHDKYAYQSFGAQFIEVKIKPDIGRLRVTRAVGVFDAGRILNAKTARSQFTGGIIMGIGMALFENTVYDPRSGQPVTDSLADYLIPTNPDIGQIDTYFTTHPDPHINALGCRGIGEIGITGVAAAVANAVYHATGKRVRDLPITPDKLI